MFLKTTSHRSREGLDNFLGYHPQYYYTWKLSGCIAEVNEEEYNKLIKNGEKEKNRGKFGIKGITKYCGKEEPKKCIKWS